MAKYRVIYEMESFINENDYEYNDLEEAIEAAQEILASWELEVIYHYNINSRANEWTDEQIEAWDHMIDTCMAWVKEYDDDGCIREYYLGNDELTDIGWMFYEWMIE